MLQAYVWDLGFQDMPVDKIVDSSLQTRERDTKASASQTEDLMRVTMEALSNKPPGSRMGPRCWTTAWLQPVVCLVSQCVVEAPRSCLDPIVCRQYILVSLILKLTAHVLLVSRDVQ